MHIYVLTNTVNGKRYVGQTRRDLAIRLGQHKKPCNNSAIARAIRKYGWDAFQVTACELETPALLDEFEEFVIAEIKSLTTQCGYNIKRGGDNHSHSEETKAKISRANKGRKFSPERIEAMRQSQLGKKASAETRLKLSIAHKGKNKGKKRPPEVIEKMRERATGKRHSRATRRKISQALTGRPVSEKTRRKISESNKLWTRTPEQIAKQAAALRGRKLSAEHRAKISAGLAGRVVTEETRAKLSAAHKGKKHSPERIEKNRQAQLGRKHTAETRAKMRAAHALRKKMKGK